LLTPDGRKVLVELAARIERADLKGAKDLAVPRCELAHRAQHAARSSAP
jgi:hypothetical protein